MRYYLSLGSNVGDREQTLLEAVRLLGQTGDVLRCSAFYYSEPWGFVSEHPFCNLCCAVETTLPPLEMLHATQAIERTLGRTKKSSNGQYADRTIDIDLIRAFEGRQEVLWQDAELTLPHPLWQEREFVTIPLKEIQDEQYGN